MKIYVDFDDCLSESAKDFSDLAAELFGIRVPYEEIRFFNLQKSFSLTDEQYARLLAEGHEPERLLSYKEVPGAARSAPMSRPVCGSTDMGCGMSESISWTSMAERSTGRKMNAA